MKKFFQEFKAFAVKGNVVDLAVAVIIGGAFGKIVSSLVSDVVMPPLSLITGGGNLADRQLILRAATGDQAAIAMNIGLFLKNIVDFLIVALVIFLMIKLVAILKDKVKGEPEPELSQAVMPTKEQELLAEIRDLLKTENKR